MLLEAWRSLWELHPRREVGPLQRLLVASLLAVALALGLMSFVAVFGRIDRPGWWWASLLPNIGICLCIVHTLFGVLWLAGRWLPAPLAERMANVRDIRAGMALSALALGGIILGMTIGFTIVPILVGFNVWGMFVSLPAALTKFAVFILFVMALNWAWWRARLRQQQLQRDATEARLRLLQGQIEPHLLFNTLANIQSLMDYDPPRAKHMLETFSGYLRVSLSQLRSTDSTLDAELDMASNYLALLQIRMDDRLRFRIDASEEARQARMPTLMLQPLVENAIHHGLAPKLDGGSVVVQAEVRAGRLHVCVTDDGVGLAAPGRPLQAGAGMAIANLRSRLHTQFGDNASLTLHERAQGAEAVLELPYQRIAGSAA
ncbi:MULTISPECIES: sensor histidine kinase [unclassified Duganella]|uniref:sensor histidine kinase n=1 Tax=unclassified Duganella TaxID=2636909 RepID=UPI0008803AA9|nr:MULTISPECIES: histidine kinase [unclassified Duganella]SDG96301.1 Histidine kinase [Duganella sp. OV458]SDJ46029.1 Histidine kinase [Duganella sp. OV510]